MVSVCNLYLRELSPERAVSSKTYVGTDTAIGGCTSHNFFHVILGTYSDHLALNEAVRIPFYKDIKTTIEEHGNTIEVVDTFDLHLGRKE